MLTLLKGAVGPEAWLPYAGAFAFWAPLLYQLPLFGGRHLPAPARVALAGVLAGSTPLALPSAESLPLLSLALQGLVGLGVGLLLRLPFELLRGLGATAAMSRGTPASWAGLTSGGEQVPGIAVGLELALLASTAEWALDHRVLRAAWALEESLVLHLQKGGELVVQSAWLGVGSWLLATLVGLALPFLTASLFVDLCLGILGRFLPQLPLFFLGQPLKALGIVLLLSQTVGELLPAVQATFETVLLLLGQGAP